MSDDGVHPEPRSWCAGQSSRPGASAWAQFSLLADVILGAAPNQRRRRAGRRAPLAVGQASREQTAGPS